MLLSEIKPAIRNAHPYRFHGTFHETYRYGYRYALHLFIEGKGAVTIRNKRYPAEKNDLLLIPPGVPHTFINDEAAPMLSYNVYFDLWEPRAAEDRHFAYAYETFESQAMSGIEPCAELEALPEHMSLQPFPRLSDDLLHLSRLFEQEPMPYRQQTANALLYGWLLQLHRIAAAPKGNADYRIRRIVEHAAESPGQLPDYDAWLRESGLQKSQFHTLFKQTTGMSPQQYIVKLKLEKAKVMLLESNRSVTSIAEQLDYPSIHYFSRQFSAQYGLSPSEYRKRRYMGD
ncbi:AraC family transcriptional regulator [Paenibacillus sp. MBLB4367]|uniref:helix-turn-helix transcriptional regulator n=1 Tax=Paenibacillus sp. MBLB4367 TaxID=3384767 RepID=UPI0039081AEB